MPKTIVKKKVKPAEKLPSLQGDYLAQTYQIYRILSEAYSLGLHKGGKKNAERKINETYIHLSQLVHSM